MEERTLKVIGIGTSLGVVIPKDDVDKLGIEKGEHIRVFFEKLKSDSLKNEAAKQLILETLKEKVLNAFREGDIENVEDIIKILENI